MLIEVLQDSIWAILPAKMEEINTFLIKRFGVKPEERLDIHITESSLSAQRKKEKPNYENLNGIAVIPLHGTLTKRVNLMTRFSGGTSTEIFQNDFTAAVKSKDVKAIVIDIDSPGGMIDGTKAAADLIYQSRGKKPIIAYGNGLMASAAYWIGSAADKVVGFDTAEIGSIGVLTTHYDLSESDKMEGIKRTEIYNGKYKRIASDTKPLTDEGKEYLQSRVDGFFNIFIENVAKNRGITVDKALEISGESRLFNGNEALERGLIDYLGNLNEAIKTAKIMTNTKKGRLYSMDIKEFKTEHEDLYKEVFGKGKEAGIEATKESMKKENEEALVTAKEEAKKEAIEAERKRVNDILSVKDADQESKEKAIKEGLNVESSYKLFFEKAQELKNKSLDALKNTEESVGGQGQEQGQSTTETSGDGKHKFEILVDEHMKETGINRGAAIVAMQKKNPEIHVEWIKSVNKDKLK